MKKIILIFVFLVIATSLLAQPQYYNYQNVGPSNTFPFGQTNGKGVNWLFLAGEFNQPTPLPSGNEITKVYFFWATGGSRFHHNFVILMAQDTITTLNIGQFYPGPWDTVYYRYEITINGTSNSWSDPITLDTPYEYDPSKSFLLFVGTSCGGGSGNYIRQAPLSNIRRVWSVGGPPYTPYNGGDSLVVNFGVDVQPVSGVINPNIKPHTYKLYQNYPNPFNPATNIKFDIHKTSATNLIIYDALGREVATLVNEELKAGSYQTYWDGSNYTSGVYFYTLQAGDYIETKKMLLLK